MSGRWAAMLTTALAMLLATGAAPALATVDEDAAAQQPWAAASAIPDIVSYTFVYERVSGSGDVSRVDGAAVLSCIADMCEMGFGQYSSDQIGSFPVPGSLVFSDPGDTPTCGNWLGANAIDIDFAFTQTSITGAWSNGGWTIECADGGSASMESYTNTIQSSELVDGACHFEPAGCTDGTGADPLPVAGRESAVDVAYGVTTQMRWLGIDGGSGDQGQRETTITLTCAGETCTPVAGDLLGDDLDLHAFAMPGRFETQRPSTGEVCDGDYEHAVTADFTFTADGVTGTWTAAPASAACEGGLSASRGFEETIVESVLLEGACWFTADGCGGAADAQPESAGAEPGVVGAGVPVVDDQAASIDEGTTSRLASGDPAAPSVLSALPPPSAASVAPQQLLLAALVTVILVLLMAFPTSLLNSAIETAGDRFAAWRQARGAKPPPEWRGSWWWAASGLLAAAIISAFVDPQFGANPGSLRVLLSIAVSFAVEIALGWVVLMWIMRRLAPTATRTFSFKPLSLLIVVAAVLLTRVTGFEPGILFGLVAGLGFASTLDVAAKARTTLVPMAYALGLGLLSWLAYGLVADTAGDSVAATLLVETLSSLTVGGMVALPLALVPIKGMSGHTVWQADPRLWGISYGIGLLAFFIVLMPMPFSWAEVGWELWAWIGVYVGYAAVAVVAWLLVKRPWRQEQPSKAPPATAPVVEPMAGPAKEPAPIMAPPHEE